MSENVTQNVDGNNCSSIKNDEILNNVMRGLTMLDKALNRLMRYNFYDRSQYPPIFFLIETLICSIREWISGYKYFSGTKNFSLLSALLLSELQDMVDNLIDTINSEKGKKQRSKKQKDADRKSLLKKFDSILDKISSGIESLESYDTYMSEQIEKYVQELFEEHIIKDSTEKELFSGSSRGEKTIIFPYSDPEKYDELVSSRKLFKEEVLKNLNSDHQTGHKKTCCEKEKSYSLIGFRSTPRKEEMRNGGKRVFEIRMGKCKTCGEKFLFYHRFYRERNILKSI